MVSGDLSALQRVQGVFADITGYPPDARAAHDIILKSRLVYEGLSDSQKAMYTSFEDFMETFANEENISAFIETMNLAAPAAAEGGENNES